MTGILSSTPYGNVFLCSLNVNAINSVLNPLLSDVKQEVFIKRRLSLTNLSLETDVSTEWSHRHRLNAPVALMTTAAFSRNVGRLFSELKLVTDNHSNGRRLLYYQAVAVKPQNIEKKSIFMFISKNIYAKVVIFLLLLDVILNFLATYIMDLNVY